MSYQHDAAPLSTYFLAGGWLGDTWHCASAAGLENISLNMSMQIMHVVLCELW